MKTKLCAKCKQILPLDLFYNNKTTKTGKASYCIRCITNYNLEHKEKFDTCIKKRYIINRDSLLKKRKVYRDKRKNTFNCTVNNLLSAAKVRSKKRNLEFNLDKEWVTTHLQPLICEATGTLLQLEIDSTYQYTPFRPSIDRTDNAKGYTKDNCKVVCTIYNLAKGVDTHTAVLKMAKAMLSKGVINE